MDKYTVILKLDEIRRLAANKKYEKALKILETLDINKIRIITDLSVFADVFEYNKQYEKAINTLLRIYEKAKTRRVLFQLSKVYAKCGDFMEAERYYDEFVDVAPRDSNRYILRYKLDKLEKKPLEELVRDLEAFKEVEYIEEWAYELAKLYHKAGYRDQCIKECSDIVLWFGDGIIVEKAKLLKAYYMGDSEPIHKMKTTVKETETPVREEEVIKEETEKETEVNIEQSLEEVNTEENIEEANTEETNTKELEETREIKKEQVFSKSLVNSTNVREKQIEDMREFVAREEFCINNISISKEMKNFMNISEVWKQLTTIFHKMNKEDNFKHIVITGNSCTGKTYMAKLYARTLYKLGYIKTSKLAMITGEKLNRIRLEEKQEKLVGGCVIVEQAGKLESRTVKKVLDMMETYEEDIIVILEDTTAKMKELILENRSLTEYVQYVIELPEYSSVELLGFAKNYLTEQKIHIGMDLEQVLREVVNRIIQQNKEENLKVLIQVLSGAIESAAQRGGEEIKLKSEDFSLEQK